ncbi:MAG: glycoside hydrolase family 97 protein [Bacteroidaceae bacterium]|nr:glycoside hydrolase family 97 protein [Bacteroidaceae bacterium]
MKIFQLFSLYPSSLSPFGGVRRGLLFLFPLFTLSLSAQTVTSPNGKLSATLLDEGGLTLSISDEGKTVVKSVKMDLVISQGKKTVHVGEASIAGKPAVKSVSEDITAPLYRQAQFHVAYNQATVRLSCGVNVELRAFDEGIAYRYVTTGFKGDYIIENEQADFTFDDDYVSYLPLTTNPRKPEAMAFQATYAKAPITRQSSLLAFLPVTIDESVRKVTIMESDLEAYPGMFLHAEGLNLKASFAKYPKTTDHYQWRDQLYVTSTENYIARCTGNRTFPWRIMAVAHDDTEMPVNNMVYALATPNRIGDYSWVKPGRVAWDWWNDWSISGVDFVSGINNDTYKYYIDFASKYGLEYIILDEGWYKPSSGDLLTTIPEIDLPMLTQYARQKNVRLILWCVFNCLDRNIEAICKKYSDMGIAGFKVDFLDRNDQTGVEMIYRIADVCARYHMMLDYHGIYAPTGINRTYPNIVNFEAVFGMEEAKWTKNGEQDMPLYDVTFPYIRMQSGYVDFTPGGFRNATAKDFQPVNNNPMTMGTRCHQMAHYVVHESPLTMFADNPTIYMQEHECTSFLASLPSRYTSMQILQGKMGEYIVTLRTDERGNYYVAGETSWQARDISLPLSFLPAGTHTAIIMTDGVNADHVATDYKAKTQQVTSTTTLDIHMASGGGFVIAIKND